MLPAFLAPASLCAFASFFSPEKLLSAAWSLSLFRRCHLQSQRTHSRSLAVQQYQLPIKANSIFVGQEPWPEHPSQHDQKGKPLWNQRNFQRSPSCPYGLGCTAWQRDFCVVEGCSARYHSYHARRPLAGSFIASPQTGRSANHPPEWR